MAYVRSENGVAGRRFLHRHRQTEGSGAQTAVLHEGDPLRRATRTVINLKLLARTSKASQRYMCTITLCSDFKGVASSGE